MESRTFADKTIAVEKGDIAQHHADALVTAANQQLVGGGGVDGAVHDAAGPELLAACGDLGGCATGAAVITPAFGLSSVGARFVVHAVGPTWRGGAVYEDQLLAGAYKRSLQLAEDNQCTSIGFPSISTGVFGFPVERAAPIAMRTVRGFLDHATEGTLKRVTFVLPDQSTYEHFSRALRDLT